MNDGLWTDGHNRSTYTQSDQWAVATNGLDVATHLSSVVVDTISSCNTEQGVLKD